jgi:magnesium chelatase family protein
MLACVTSVMLRGIEGMPVTIEVDVANGLPGFSLVGLPDSSVRESRERVFAALKHAGYVIPSKRITINLAPADHRKEGSLLDLPIAVALLAASGQVQIPRLSDFVLAGELSLDGALRPIRGALTLGLFAQRNGFKGVVLPRENARLLSGFSGLQALGAADLASAISVMQGREVGHRDSPAMKTRLALASTQIPFPDFAEIRGHTKTLRALEVAAAGGHHCVLLGSPGCGKSMMVRRLPGIMPPMTQDEAFEVTQIYDAAGVRDCEEGLVNQRPFRQPHHTVSPQALVGGGPKLLPGEVSLAHHGVLFLDEWPEFQRSAIESLRQPLEDGSIQLAKAAFRVRYPCRFLLAAAMNPCACGFMYDAVKQCTCDPEEVIRYRRRISGPMFDRIDMHIAVPRLSTKAFTANNAGESSQVRAARVHAARQRQVERLKSDGAWQQGATCNAHISGMHLNTQAALGSSGQALLMDAAENLGLTARAFDRIRRVARTLADLAGEFHIRDEHVAEAIEWRTLDRDPDLEKTSAWLASL